MSFDVKIVKNDVKKYNTANKTICFPLAYFKAKLAKYSKNPNSSKTIDINVIEKNKTIIFIGFIESLLNNPSIALSKLSKPLRTIIIAPKSGIIQKV